MEGFAEIRKQPRAVACLNDKFQFYYCMTKAFIHRQMGARRFVSAKLLLEEGCELLGLERRTARKDPERRLLHISGIVYRYRLLCRNPTVPSDRLVEAMMDSEFQSSA